MKALVAVVLVLFAASCGRPPFGCPDGLSDAVLDSLWPLPQRPTTEKELATSVEWLRSRRAWVEAQAFDACTVRAYENWIDYVEKRVKAGEAVIRLRLPKARGER